jgi:hypothetical protein
LSSPASGAAVCVFSPKLVFLRCRAVFLFAGSVFSDARVCASDSSPAGAASQGFVLPSALVFFLLPKRRRLRAGSLVSFRSAGGARTLHRRRRPSSRFSSPCVGQILDYFRERAAGGVRFSRQGFFSPVLLVEDELFSQQCSVQFLFDSSLPPVLHTTSYFDFSFPSSVRLRLCSSVFRLTQKGSAVSTGFHSAPSLQS